MLHARQYSHAVAGTARVIELEPAMPEAHVNMGYRAAPAWAARQARDSSRERRPLRPAQANAYFGLAMALEAGGDMPAAIGAMRTFVHLSAPDDPFVRKARAALWECRRRACRPVGHTGVANDGVGRLMGIGPRLASGKIPGTGNLEGRI